MTDVLILCGGYNTRLRSVLPEGMPKVLADVHGVPFLRLLVDRLRQRGDFRVTLCTGYGMEAIRDYLLTKWPDHGLDIIYEGRPIGTFSAVVNAVVTMNLRGNPSKWTANPFLVLNGDTFCTIDYADLLKQHSAGSYLLTVATDQSDTPIGTFVVDRSLTFLNPSPPPGRNLEDFIAEARPKIHVASYVTTAPWYDIGTPEGLERFRQHSRILFRQDSV